MKSELLKDAFPSYEIVNMGVIGGVNASMQLDCIIPFLETGDIFIHTPEEMSDFQHLNNFDMDSRSFILFEGNYDYLKYINFSNCNKFFSAFHEYVDIREYFPSQNYTDYNSNYNYYGDICITRPLNDDNSIFNLENCFDNKSLKSFNTLNEYYKKIQEKGVTNYFSFAPLNLNAYNKNKNDNDIYKNEYVELLSSKLKFTTIISNIDDYIIEGKYFYDEDYHLNDEGAIKRTKKLIEDLNSVERK